MSIKQGQTVHKLQIATFLPSARLYYIILACLHLYIYVNIFYPYIILQHFQFQLVKEQGVSAKEDLISGPFTGGFSLGDPD